MEDIYVVGIGATRFGKFLECSVKDLARDAVELAMSDAGARQEDIGAAYFANATQSVMDGQHMIAGQVALRSMGFERLPVFNIENACASGSTALHLACNHIRAGQSDAVLVVGVDKMYSSDKLRSMSLFDGAIDVNDIAGVDARLAEIAGELPAGEQVPPGAEGAQPLHGRLCVAGALSHAHVR